MSTRQGKPFSLMVFALQWSVATGLGWFLSFLAFATQSDYYGTDIREPVFTADRMTVVLLFGLAGLVTASCQAWVLRRRVAGWHWWIVVSTAGSVAGAVWLLTRDWDPIHWWHYPAFTTAPMGVTQGAFLLWLSLRNLGRTPLKATMIAVSWALVKSAVLGASFVGFLMFALSGALSGRALSELVVLLPLVMGLPFGFFSGLFLAVLIKPRARQAPAGE